MTPEERLDRIEGTLLRTAELQAQQAEQLSLHGAEIEKQNVRFCFFHSQGSATVYAESRSLLIYCTTLYAAHNSPEQRS